MRKLALVFAGGFCGTLARYALSPLLLAFASAYLPAMSGDFPWDIFLINLSGAFALGLLYGLCERGLPIPPNMRLALGTGFLGAYTTFSSFAVGGEKLLSNGHLWLGLAYLIGSLLLGVLSARAGFLMAGLLGKRRQPAPTTPTVRHSEASAQVRHRAASGSYPGHAHPAFHPHSHAGHPAREARRTDRPAHHASDERGPRSEAESTPEEV